MGCERVRETTRIKAMERNEIVWLHTLFVDDSVRGDTTGNTRRAVRMTGAVSTAGGDTIR